MDYFYQMHNKAQQPYRKLETVEHDTMMQLMQWITVQFNMCAGIHILI